MNAGQVLILLGVVFVVVGFLLNSGVRIPWLGLLPGDIYVDNGNFNFYFPITTSIIISVVLSVLVRLFNK